VESIVDMGKDIDPDPDQLEKGHQYTLRQRDPSHILKSRRYREKAVELGQGLGEEEGDREAVE
jgi:hypothetical protein